MNEPDVQRARVPAVAGLAAVAAAFVAATWRTWHKWPDILVDSGVQLYLAWRISSGAVLYRDVSHLNGPLSQYVDASLFRVFGVSASTLFDANLVLAALLTVIVYVFLARRAGALAATAAGFVLVLGFAFAQYVGVGDQNYVAPYCHEATHGLFLAVLLVIALSRWTETARRRWAAWAGLCLGLTLLTKPEVFLASVVVTGAGLWLRRGQGRAHRGLTLFALSALAGPASFVVALLGPLGAPGSLRAVFWPWIVLASSHITDNAFYRWSLGLDEPLYNAEEAALYAAAFAVALLVAAWCSRGGRRTHLERILSIAGLAALAAVAWGFPWTEAGRALPVVTLVAAGAFLVEARRGGSPGLALWSVLGLALLAKMGIHGRLWQYGFTLAMPATLCLVVFVLAFLPARLARVGVDPRRFRAAAIAVLAIGLVQLVRVSDGNYAAKTFPLGHGADAVETFEYVGDEPEGRDAALALDWIESNTAPRSTLAVFPEGVALNYLARRRNPTRYVSFIPEEIAVYGEDAMLHDLEASPPDTVVLVHRDTTDHGVRFFGQAGSPGSRIMDWIQGHYTVRWLVGAEPLKTDAFGIEILTRK